MKIQLPKISNILDPYQNDPTIFYDHYIQDIKFEQTVIQNIENQNITIDACRFDHVSFQNIQFEQAELLDIVFDHCEFENTHFLKCSLYRVQFINCRCMGIEISDSLLDNTLFDSCNNAYSDYGMSTLKKFATKIQALKILALFNALSKILNSKMFNSMIVTSLTQT